MGESVLIVTVIVGVVAGFLGWGIGHLGREREEAHRIETPLEK